MSGCARVPSTDGDIIGTVNAGDWAKMLEKTDTRYSFKNGKMVAGAGYPWHKIKVRGGKTGWVYGRYLAHLRGRNPEKLNYITMDFSASYQEADVIWLDPNGDMSAEITVYPFFFDADYRAYLPQKGDQTWKLEDNGGDRTATKVGVVYDGEANIFIEFTTEYLEKKEKEWFQIPLPLRGDPGRVIED